MTVPKSATTAPPGPVGSAPENAQLVLLSLILVAAVARSSFLAGADWAYMAGIIAVLVGGAIVFLLFPRKADEQRLLAEYHAEDTRSATAA